MRLWVKRYDAERLAVRAASVNGGQLAANVDTPGSNEHSPAAAGSHDPLLERELDSMRRQLQKLQAENDVLKRAFIMFSSEWSKQPPSKD